ncbi:MAG TPA: DUF6496 domain-containing protein [Polyangiaceae bacterium]|nr:DUF6496 domain-containing protein [Polyangiaceae bacterium]
MPENKTVRRAHEATRKGRAPSTAAGEFVREEVQHIRRGKHGARSAKQAIAIGLSKARRAGVNLAPPKEGKVSPAVRRKAQRDLQVGRRGAKAASARRSAASLRALKQEGRKAASPRALSTQARTARRPRGKASAGATKRRRAPRRASAKS